MIKIGQKAPDFKTTTASGERFKLSDYKGKKVLLYWYVRDNTSGCQAQSCSLRDNYEVLLDNDVLVFGIAPGSEKSHQDFKRKNNLPFPLLMDKDNSIAKLYDVWKKKKMYGKEYIGIERTSFLIDEYGKISKIIGKHLEGEEKVQTKGHAEQVIRMWDLKM